MIPLTKIIVCTAAVVLTAAACSLKPVQEEGTGNVIFLHPDGSSLSAWNALRILDKGPDGMLAWDRMDALSVYRGHIANSLVSSSNAGATIHAYGVKADYDDYGIDTLRPIESMSGKSYSILTEAHKAGILTGLINSGHIAEPGTGVFASSSQARANIEEITLEIIESGTDVILSGGEILLLPEGTRGHHGIPGLRTDGRNLIEHARTLGYTIVYTRKQLVNLPDTVSKVFGVFAANHTFHDDTEESLKSSNISLYNPDAPSVAEMTEFTLDHFNRIGKQFFIVVEEEGSDNFANYNNASGTLEALRRADACIKVIEEFIEKQPNTMLITAADSDAGGMSIRKVLGEENQNKPLPPHESNGAPLDGIDGTGSLPFISAPDLKGNRWPFGIAWASSADLGGGILVKVSGMNAGLLPPNIDNTGIYWMIYRTLFGIELEDEYWELAGRNRN